jgi:hypothetical protein
MFVWTGAVSDDWSDAQNWFDHGVPDATTDVFVPSAAGGQSPVPRYPKLPDASPTQETHALMTETLAHIDLNGKELYVRDSLAADGAIVGPGTVALGVAPTSVRGIVNALLELGEDGCPNANHYRVSGFLVANSILANCRLEVLDETAVVFVSGDFRAPGSGGGLTLGSGAIEVGRDALFDGGGLSQSDGTFVVIGNTVLNGATYLTGGALAVGGNFSHTGGCSGHSIFATAAHTTTFYGTADPDTLRITWNADVECTSRLGTVEIATTGDKGMTIAATRPLWIENLHILAGAKLRVPLGVDLTAGYSHIIGTGVFIQDGGILTNDGSVSVPQGAGDNCPVGLGVIMGPFICANHAS